MASQMPRLGLRGATEGGATAGPPGVLVGTVTGGGVATLAGVGVGTAAGVFGAGVGALRGVCGVSTSVVAPEGLGVGVIAVVPDGGNGLTGTLPSAARKASAL